MSVSVRSFLGTLALSLFVVGSTARLARADGLSAALDKARSKRLGSHQQWLNLLHYQARVFGGYKSQADNADFFFAAAGKTDPQAELEATLKAVFDSGPEDLTNAKAPQHPQCAFPARFLFLQRELALDLSRLPRPRCERFRKFRDTIAARSVTFVFSSYYLNNPASTFGHSFLRLNKADASAEGRRYELLDYGFNYSALVTTNNALIYAVSGVAGLFPGTFATVPYYYKVREYNDYESRDLWEYDLNLNPEQVEMIVAHVWELGQALFNYYYLDENCSYHVLTLLDAAAPELGLARRLGPIVIPADTVKLVVETPGLVRGVRYRPSGRVQFASRLAGLSSEQRVALSRVTQRLGSETDLATLSEEQRIGVLDAAIDYVDFLYSKDLFRPESEAAIWKQRLLRTRSQIQRPSPKLEIETPRNEMPHLGHDSRRLSVGYGHSRQSDGHAQFAFRYALHDLLDATPGYPAHSQMELFNVALRYERAPRRLKLEEFALLQVMTLSPLNDFSHRLSWRVRLGAKTIRDLGCDGCVAADAVVGAGHAVEPFSFLGAFALLEAQVNGSPSLNRSPVRLGLGPTVGVRLPASERWISLAQASYRPFLFAHDPRAFEASVESRYALQKNLAFNARWSRFAAAKEVSGGILYYF